MSIDLGKEFKRMTEEFNLSDKEVFTSVRTMLRRAWSDSIFKQDFLNKQSVLVENTNPRSKKRFPQVRRFKCAICGEYFGSNEIELDHLVDENSLKSYDDINTFMLNIVLTSPDKLQVLCKDKKKTVKGKKVLVEHGCHGIKTFSSRYGCSFEEAKLKKKLINICKDKQLLIDTLLSTGLKSSDVPKTKKGQEELLYKLLLEKENE